MDIIFEIRRRHLVQKQSISAISRDMGIYRPTVRKHLILDKEPKYHRKQPPAPILGEFEATLRQWLEQESTLPRQRQRTAQRLFEGLQVIGYCSVRLKHSVKQKLTLLLFFPTTLAFGCLAICI